MHRRYVPSAKITKTARRRLIRRINLYRFAPFSFFFSLPSSPRLTRRARTTAPLKFNIYTRLTGRSWTALSLYQTEISSETAVKPYKLLHYAESSRFIISNRSVTSIFYIVHGAV